jgi:zinc/manganese transport system substrate-binding protein
VTAAAALTAVTAVLAGCATSAPAAKTSGAAALRVVAAENFWGSIASQIGGSKVNVTSIIDNPNTDPHDYEPTPADARTIAGAQLVIVNGVGYDPWATKLLAANAGSGRTVLTVGDLVGVAPGGNPHRWYDPANVEQVISAVTADLQKLDPADSAYFAAQRTRFDSQGLAAYHRVIDAIKSKYAGTPVGASESIIALMALALGLDLKTPQSFLKAISEGTEPTAADKTAIDNQIRTHAIKVYVYNSQNATPDVQAQINAAKSAGIPITTITETLTPATASFQNWQVRQLTELQAALAKATGQ